MESSTVLIHLIGRAIVNDLPGSDTNYPGGVLESQLHMVDVDEYRNVHIPVDS